MQSRTGSVILIIVGVLFLLHNLDILSFSFIGSMLRTWWPAILIVVGVLGLTGKIK